MMETPLTGIELWGLVSRIRMKWQGLLGLLRPCHSARLAGAKAGWRGVPGGEQRDGSHRRIAERDGLGAAAAGAAIGADLRHCLRGGCVGGDGELARNGGGGR